MKNPDRKGPDRLARSDASPATQQVTTHPSRRTALAQFGTLLSAPFILSSESRAQAAWPTRPVRYINPFPAGGATDTLSRLFCAKMSELTGQQFVVENRGGGGGDIGVEAVARSAPDGYTLGLGGVASHAISPTLKAGKLPFDSAKDFTFITNIWSLPNFLVGFSGLHLAGELFKLLAKVDLIHVPYRGAAPAMTDLIGGQVHLMFDNIPGGLMQYKPGKVKGFAVTSKARSPVVPDIPALSEFLPGYDLSSWTSLAGPSGMPAAVVERISMFSKQALESASLKQEFMDRGATATWLSTQEATAFRASEEKRLGDIIRAAKITLD